MTAAALISQIDALPDNLKQQVENFVAFLTWKYIYNKDFEAYQSGILKPRESSIDLDNPL